MHTVFSFAGLVKLDGSMLFKSVETERCPQPPLKQGHLAGTLYTYAGQTVSHARVAHAFDVSNLRTCHRLLEIPACWVCHVVHETYFQVRN